MGKLSGKVLMEIFEQAFKDSATYKRLDSERNNPGHIMFNGEEYYVYIKNLSPAYFENPDVWRAQMTGIDALKEIKESNATFVLLGFDSDNDVYATWDPTKVKQRIGTASSPSLYSRLSLQQEVSKTGEIRSMTLNNDLQVLVFPLDSLVDVFSSLNEFFPDTSDYVAMGSKRRVDANMAYKKLTNMHQLDDFAKYLISIGISSSDISQMCRSVKSIISSGVISWHRKIFLAHDSISEYKEAAEELFSLQSVRDLGWDDRYRVPFLSYIDFLQKKHFPSTFEDVTDKNEDITEDQEIEVETSDEERNLESDYEDEYGNLVKLMNPELLKQLRPYLDKEYPSLPPAYNIIEDFYHNRYPKMQMKDWGRLIKEIDWSRCNEDGIIPEEVKASKRKTHILRVVFPDGRVVEDKNVSTTYCEFIKEVGAEEISILGISHAGVNIVSKELDSKYANYQRDIGDGWYVMTNSSTPIKYQDLQKIIEEYGLDISVSLVSLDSSNTPSLPIPNEKNGKREKIRVVFPDGRCIQPTKVLEALIEVVKYAGVERVHSLNIICCADNLILKNPAPRYINPSKPVGDGWLCNTCSDTRTKYDQIRFISEKLNLGLEVELV
ncbi:MAG: hypothetical protein J6W12_03025 [Bacteroidales bacterium]|nr:hypothetical protein [Bacteroidales bacterium]